MDPPQDSTFLPSGIHQLVRGAELAIAPWYITSYFVPLAIYRAYEAHGYYSVDDCCAAGQFLVWQDQEPAEMFFALGFLVFALVNVARVKLELVEGSF